MLSCLRAGASGELRPFGGVPADTGRRRDGGGLPQDIFPGLVKACQKQEISLSSAATTVEARNPELSRWRRAEPRLPATFLF